MKPLPAMRDAVCDKKSFVEFLEALSMDWSCHLSDRPTGLAPHPANQISAEWQSSTIGDFLDAAVRAGDGELDGVKVYEQPANHWHRAACILYGGKRYD